MQHLTSIISDSIVVFFDLLIYTRLTRFKRDTPGTHALVWAGCAIILALYLLSTYVWSIPTSIASFLCMSLPSFLFFWQLSAYKDARFVVTFCFVDTVSLILGFFSRAVGIWADQNGGLISCILLLLLFAILYYMAHPFFPQYRDLLNIVEDGWNVQMVSTLLIHFLLVFSAGLSKTAAGKAGIPGLLHRAFCDHPVLLCGVYHHAPAEKVPARPEPEASAGTAVA